MDSGIQKSILQMARGAIQERADYEMSSLLNNILDPNTSATAARKLTITLTLKPDDTRQNITFVPYARYLHEGKVMVNAETGQGPGVVPGVGPRWRRGDQLKATEQDLTYTVTKNPEAGPFWGKRLQEKEGDAMLADLKNYVQGRGDPV